MKTLICEFSALPVILLLLLASRWCSDAQIVLGSPTCSNGQFYFEVHGESMASYVVFTTTNLADWTPVVTNEFVASVSTVVCPAPSSRAFFRVQALPSPVFRSGLVAKDVIEMNGNNITTDSFDSADPSASTNGLYTPSKHKDHGDLAAISGITNSLYVGKASIWGTASTGPLGSVWIGPYGVVGDAVWHNNGLAQSFSYFGLPSNTSLSIGGNGDFTGTVYAPNAALIMNGGGNNTIDFMGASITKSIKMNGHFNFHYDENLRRLLNLCLVAVPFGQAPRAADRDGRRSGSRTHLHPVKLLGCGWR